jgi:eukaryotic-like serine/threonine-protein kinase
MDTRSHETRPVAAPAGMAPGQRLGRYVVLEDPGAEVMGATVSAYDTLLERKVALKLLTASMPAAPGGAPAFELAEATAIARLSHPNVVKVHDVVVHEGMAFLALELVDGVTLATWLLRQRPGPRQIARVMAAAARGLAAAHAAGVVHGNVTPQAILVAGARVQVTNFGLPAPAGGAADPASAPGSPYRAPEQLRGGPVDARADVFGFCATLYEAMHGQPPFSSGGPIEPGPRSRVPARLHALAMRGLDPDPAQRPADMAAVAAALLSDPAARRRRLALALAGAAAVAGAFWGGGYLTAHPERRCRASAEVMTDTWNEARRAQLGRRYDRAGLGGNWSALRRRLDQYAGSWRDVYADGCSARYGRRNEPERLFAARVECLDSQRGAVDAFVAALSTAAPNQLVKAAAAELPSLADCQLTAGSAAKPRPRDPASRAQLAAIERQLAQSLAEQNLGDYERAAATAAAAVAGARKLGHEPLLAETLVRLAVIGKLRGGGGASAATGLEQSAKQLEDAYAVAELGRDDRQRLAAAREQVSTQLHLGDLPAAEKWARLGEALLSRTGSPPNDATLLKAHVGWLHFMSGRLPEATASFRSAIDWSRKIVPPDPRRAAGAQGSLCAILSGRKDSPPCARKALAAGLEAYGPGHPELGAFYSYLGDELMLDPARLTEACQAYQDAFETQRTLDPAYPNVIMAHIKVAACRRTQGRFAEASALYERALAARPRPLPRGQVHEEYGEMLVTDLPDFDAGLGHLRAALADYEVGFGPTSEVTLGLRARIAMALLEQGRGAEALREIDGARDIARKAQLTGGGAGHVQAWRARILVELARPEEAVREARAGRALIQGGGAGEKQLGVSLLAEGLGELQLGRVREAVAALERALAARREEPDFPWVLADIEVALARALWQREGDRDRACTLARAAASFYRAHVGWRRSLRQAERWLARQRCLPTA